MTQCCCTIYADGPSCCTEELRTARKPYRCCECHESIEPGDTYEYVRGLWDDHWATYRTCKTCAQIRNDYCKCGYVYGELGDQISECLGVEL